MEVTKLHVHSFAEHRVMASALFKEGEGACADDPMWRYQAGWHTLYSAR
jgi:hypothetical protein